MKKFTLYIMVLLAALSCSQKAEYNRTLGLLSRYNVLGAGAGGTQVAVFSNTSWTVEMVPKVYWATIDRFGGEKSGYLEFDYDINYGRSRRVDLVFRAGDETMTLTMFQKAFLSDKDCIMDLETPTPFEVPAEGLVQEFPFKTNLVYDLDDMFLTLTYPEGQEPAEPWITLLGVEKDKVTIRIAPNATGAPRQANARVSHTDAGETYDSEEGTTIYSDTINVLQSK